MGRYCDKCRKSDEETGIISIQYVEINTDDCITDKRYVDEDPHLCKKCFKEFKKSLEELIISTFGHL